MKSNIRTIRQAILTIALASFAQSSLCSETIDWRHGAPGNRSWMAADNWASGLVPSAGFDYVVSETGARNPIDALHSHFAGGSLTVWRNSTLRVHTTGLSVPDLRIGFASIRNQKANRASSLNIDTLRFIDDTTHGDVRVSEATSSMTLNIATLIIDPGVNVGTSSYDHKGAVTLNLANDVQAYPGAVFQLNDIGSLSFTGSGSTAVMGLDITGDGKYVLERSEVFASVKIGANTLSPGTYSFQDLNALGYGSSFIDNGGSLTVVP